jgi:hypothetical protein
MMMTDKWQWWSGSCEEIYTLGPFETKQEAIEEALSAGVYEELEEPTGSWKAGVYVAEHKGTYFDCDECGRVKKACEGCVAYLSAEESAFYFSQTRNEDFCVLNFEDDDD